MTSLAQKKTITALSDQTMGQQKGMTFWQHLAELRHRLIVSLIALLLSALISLVFARQIFELLLTPIGQGEVIALDPTETIIVYFKVAFLSGLVLAMPVVVYQFIRFVAPGLTPTEKRWLYLFIPAASLSFAAGVAFAALVVLPFAVNYLQNFLSDIVTQTWAISPYIDFVVTFLIAMGLVFETPLVVFFLAKIGIVTPAFLSHYRRHAILIIAIIAAVITPTPDPFNMLLVLIPLWVLYEIGILLARLA